MALTMWGQLIVQSATPGEAPAQVGSVWVDTTTTPVIKLCTSISPYTWATASGGVSDGDKGDITVSGSGATWTIDNGVVTPAKMNDGAAVSVLGRSANSSGVRADIAAAADGEFLRRRASVVGFGTILNTDVVSSEFSTTATGNQDNVDFDDADVLICNNATDLTIRGLADGSDGQRVTIISRGAGHVLLAHQNTNSTAANRLINFATGSNTPLAAGVGRATYVYSGDDARWVLAHHDQGAFITPTFAAGNFTASGSMTWTVESADVANYSYMLIGRMMVLAWVLNATTQGGTADQELRVAVPGGFAIAKNAIFVMGYTSDNGTVKTGIAFPQTPNTYVSLYNDNTLSSNWAGTGTNTTTIRASIIIEVT
jgi:hypothetical protein